MEATVRLKSASISQHGTNMVASNDGVHQRQSGHSSQPSGYAPVVQEELHSTGKNAGYHLEHYFWRSFLTTAGPLTALAFYAFICFHYLAHPLSNNIFPSQPVDATRVYYCWFLTSVFILEWARSGLANIEASALMMPHLAPPTAKELMWHTDTNWANPLWWLRAMRSVLWMLVPRRQRWSQSPIARPSLLWTLLSFIHISLFLAIPLSGLSLEVVDASTYTMNPVRIYGPNETSFNARGWLDFPRGIRREWESGRQTSPTRGALLYAPHGIRNISATYFDDQAIEAARNSDGAEIRVFAGPAVRETIWGEAWGMSANISCLPTPVDQLQMIRSDGYNSSVNICSTRERCEFEWLDVGDASRMNEGFEHILNVPAWLNESRQLEPQSGLQSHSLLAAADGWSTMFLQLLPNASRTPYSLVNNHDNWTFDHIVRAAPSDDITNSMFEMLLWQQGASEYIPEDEIFKSFRKHPSPLMIVHNGTTSLLHSFGANYSGSFAGFGVHCDIKSAVGTATLDPDTRTFSKFVRGKAATGIAGFFYPMDLAPVQIQAMASIAGNQHFGNLNGTLGPKDMVDVDRVLTESTWVGIHRAIGSTALPRDGYAFLAYPTLTPENLTLAMYKLLGESVISVMGEGGVMPWTSPSIHATKPAKYIRPGAVPWQLVLSLLAVWAISTSLGAISTALLVGPRWAPTLNGFELFKFGAQYQEEVHQLEAVDFRECTGSLSAIPGMIGILPGCEKDGPSDLRFVGLSNDVSPRLREVTYTLNRRKATKGGQV